MTITIPIYVEKVSSVAGDDLFVVSPLFADSPTAQAQELSKAMRLLVKALRTRLGELAREGDCDRLLEYLAPPEWEDHSYKITIELRKQAVAGRFHVVAFRRMGRRLAFTPTVPDLWLEYGRGENLRRRAEEVLTHHYLKEEKKWDASDDIKQEIGGRTSTWTTEIDLDIYPARRKRRKGTRDEPFAFLGGSRSFFGDEELEKVGRCLDYLYPDELERVVGRASHVEELSRLLKAADNPPVLLLGPAKVGKTAILHEVVYSIVKNRKSPYRSRKNTWLLSPQRLISGMSFVGEWEDRLLAIVKEARKRDHTLYFDDILGLFQAGVCASSDLSVAHVLKPYLERREVRVVGEMTPEAFHVLQEKDRGFADLFHIIRVDEPEEGLNCRIMVWIMRRLENKHLCRFGLDVLPAVLDLQRRYVRGLAFPGKAAMFLEQLAVRLAQQDITRERVLDTFHRKSGLSVAFLDTRAKLVRKDVVEALTRRIVGQAPAVAAMTDVVAVAKARLNDPERPLAAFLFLGPTGVGKTQCAKTLAAYLFGSEERLLRFDMNEFVSDDAVARLVGTFHAPEGLLTAAIRRQPFSVVLLDEIEKANPDVFALLLQVMGEGRLTDAQGRSVDFGNAIIILTSNLGTRQAGKQLGFGAGDRRQDAVYVEAAEKFFAPEFVNRLDRVIPFAQLTREEVAGIARILIQDVLGREGWRGGNACFTLLSRRWTR